MSKANESFEAALKDVENLLFFHEAMSGSAPGKRASSLQSLNKSAVVLLCSCWESYVEYVIQEAAFSKIDVAATPAALPKPLKTLMTNHIRSGKNEAAWEAVAGDGWKDLSRLVVRSKLAALNTPKRGQVAELMHAVLGVAEIDRNWGWHKNWSGEPATNLDEFVKLRGAIAHGEKLSFTVPKSKVTFAKDLIKRLVEKVEERLSADGLIS